MTPGEALQLMRALAGRRPDSIRVPHRRPGSTALLAILALTTACRADGPATRDGDAEVAARSPVPPPPPDFASGPGREPLPWEPGVRPDRIVFVKHMPGSLVWTVVLAPSADSAQVAAFGARAARATGARVNPPFGWPERGTPRETLLELELAPGWRTRDSARVARWLAGDALVLRAEPYRAGVAR